MSGYLDAATVTPLHPAGREALIAALTDGWADPERLYPTARRARQLLEAAGAAMADVLGVRTEELHLTTGGAAAAHLAIAGTRLGRHRIGATVIHSAVEHSAVLRSAGEEAVRVPVDRLGRVDVDAFASAVRGPGVALAALMSANHEVGTCQPVAEVAAHCEQAGVPLYCDAAASIGRSTVPTGWSLLSGSARKWGGPAGVGILVIRTGTRWVDPRPVASPVNISLAVAAAAALRAAAAEADTQARRQTELVERIRRSVAVTIADVDVVGDPADRLPHVVTLSFLYIDGEALVHALAREGFAVSSGSACSADTLRPSHVLAAMGVLTHGNIRVSLSRDTSEADVDRLLTVLPRVVGELRAQAGVAGL